MVPQTSGMSPTTQHSVLGENFFLIGQIFMNQNYFDQIFKKCIYLSAITIWKISNTVFSDELKSQTKAMNFEKMF